MLLVNKVGLYTSFPCQESMTQSILFHSYMAVGIELLSTGEADSEMLWERIANICNNVH